MKIARVSYQETARFGLVDGAHVGLLPARTTEVAEVFELHRSGTLASKVIDQVGLDAVRLLAPIANPPQFIGIGLNYRDHAMEAGAEIPTAPITFGFFANAICGPGDPIVIPAFATDVDWEAELAIVIGTAGRDIPVDSALDHVAGYTLVNDVSERQVQMSEGQWGRSKSFDSFKPIGPWIVTADEVDDASNLTIELWVSDQRKQSSNTSQLIFGVRELVSRLSQSTTLLPGAVISTGTPGGVGFTRTPPEFLRDGDVVRIAVQGVGELSNPVCADVR